MPPEAIAQPRPLDDLGLDDDVDFAASGSMTTGSGADGARSSASSSSTLGASIVGESTFGSAVGRGDARPRGRLAGDAF